MATSTKRQFGKKAGKLGGVKLGMFVSVVLIVDLALFSQSMPACQFRMCVVDSQIICLTGTSYPSLLLSVIIIVIRSILLNAVKHCL